MDSVSVLFNVDVQLILSPDIPTKIGARFGVVHIVFYNIFLSKAVAKDYPYNQKHSCHDRDECCDHFFFSFSHASSFLPLFSLIVLWP